MSIKINNEKGTITINKESICNVVGLSAIGCYGIVGMASKNVTDGLVQLLKRDNLSRGVQIFVNENDEINVDLHIIVEFGTNIIAICESLISSVNYNVEETFNLKLTNINVLVEGIRVNK